MSSDFTNDALDNSVPLGALSLPTRRSLGNGSLLSLVSALDTPNEACKKTHERKEENQHLLACDVVDPEHSNDPSSALPASLCLPVPLCAFALLVPSAPLRTSSVDTSDGSSVVWVRRLCHCEWRMSMRTVMGEVGTREGLIRRNCCYPQSPVSPVQSACSCRSSWIVESSLAWSIRSAPVSAKQAKRKGEDRGGVGRAAEESLRLRLWTEVGSARAALGPRLVLLGLAGESGRRIIERRDTRERASE